MVVMARIGHDVGPPEIDLEESVHSEDQNGHFPQDQLRKGGARPGAEGYGSGRSSSISVTRAATGDRSLLVNVT
jgi:hypothetical protein